MVVEELFLNLKNLRIICRIDCGRQRGSPLKASRHSAIKIDLEKRSDDEQYNGRVLINYFTSEMRDGFFVIFCL